MKILLFTDLHMCPRASIVNKWGVKYPLRLENCIKSVNWVERLAKSEGCALIINLGDFYDRPDLSSETITASTDIEWSDIPHYSLVGNHDASVSSLEFNSVNNLLGPTHTIITEPIQMSIDGVELCFLPYIVESDRQALKSYFNHHPDKKHIILSHNDLNGIQLGPIVSKTGFTVEEIEACCDLFLNGHLHNGQKITDKVINLGNLTGKDFGEDASKHAHKVAILDTDTLSLSFVENPFAFNFYKIQIESEEELCKLNALKDNAVVSIKCPKHLVEDVRTAVASASNIIESRVIIIRTQDDMSESSDTSIELAAVDHLARFVECCKANIDNTKLLDEELAEVCK